jgi:hypothetical protein
MTTPKPTPSEIKAARAKLRAAQVTADEAERQRREAEAEAKRRQAASELATSEYRSAVGALRALLDWGKVQCGYRLVPVGGQSVSFRRCENWAQPDTDPPRCGRHKGQR